LLGIPHVLPFSFSLIWPLEQYMLNGTQYEDPYYAIVFIFNYFLPSRSKFSPKYHAHSAYWTTTTTNTTKVLHLMQISLVQIMHGDHTAVGQKCGVGNVLIALTFKWLVWYLNFRKGFIKNVLLGQKKINYEWHFVKNTTEIMQNVSKMQSISLLPK
jgi:hypothetical protein